ncbi:hypothetical protein RJ639_001040, partial [Escallonia herrerae]
MGGRGRSRTQRKHFRQSRENVWKRTKTDSTQHQQQPDTTDSNNGTDKKHWEPFATQNYAFDEYYKEQGIVHPEEWDTFIEFLRKPLPAAFRINSSSQFSVDILSQLENDFVKSIQAEGVDGSESEAIRPLLWYPENLAWQSNFSRMQLRKNQTLERFHEFLKQENEIGNITRQETVSMVPPLFLDVHPDHFVLDMCAAPGSKTFQLLEMIHRSAEPESLPNGMEPYYKREEPGISELLFDRVLCDVPCSGDGTLRKAPDIWRKWAVGMGNGLHCLQVQIAMRGLSLLKVGGRMVYSTCSMNPVENEAVVAEILRRCGRSIELLDVSAELPQLVRRPGLKKWKVQDKGAWSASYEDVPVTRRSGIVQSMFPCGKSFVEKSGSDHAATLGDIKDNGDTGNSVDGSSLTEDPVALTDLLKGEDSTFSLEYCMRIVPHDQNTGAFFIAVFHKLSSLPAIEKKPVRLRGQLNGANDNEADKLADEAKEVICGMEVDAADTGEQIPEETPCADLTNNEKVEAALDTDPIKMPKIEVEEMQAPREGESGPEIVKVKRKLQMQGKWRGVDPVVFFKDDVVVDKIKAFYGINDAFPFNGHLVTRNSDTNHVKRIYYISKSAKDVLQLNFLAGQQLKITSIGLKMFERQTSKEGTSSTCAFRISSEGLPLLLPHITKQILWASPVDFKHLLKYKTIKFADFVDAEFGERASKLMLGCCVVVLNKGGQPLSDSPQVDASTIAIGCWRGRNSISVM